MEEETDSRMTNETKIFVANSLKVARPNSIPKADINLNRQAREINANKILEALNFDHLEIRKLTVENKNDGYDIPVQALIPKNVVPNSSITIFYHGGGWTFGSSNTHFYSVASVASKVNTVWLSVDYRLGPEHKFQTQMEDCRSVLEWVAKNKTQFSSESAKIGVSGDSAGGHYSAILTHEYRNLIDYQVLIYPCVDLANTYESNKEFSSECFYLTKEMIGFFVNNFIANLEDLGSAQVSPLLNQDFTRLPKCLIVAAELDPLIDQIKVYHEKLAAHSNQSDLKVIKGTIHGYFHNGFFFKEAMNETLQHISDFFKEI